MATTPKDKDPLGLDDSDDEEVDNLLGKNKRGSPNRKAALEGNRKRQQQQSGSSTKKKKKKSKEKSPTGSKASSTKSSSKSSVKKEVVTVSSRKRFTVEEDQFLCRAYVNITANAKKGADQRGKVYWKKIHKRYEELYHAEAEVVVIGRTWKQLSGRFYRQIQKQINQFNPYFKQIKEAKPSGVPMKDYIDEAAALMEEMDDEKFKFQHCVEILQQLPRFDPMVEEVSSDDDDNNNKSPSATTPKTPINKIGTAMGGKMTRPIGSKKTKHLERLAATASVAGSIETSKVESVNNLAKSTRELSTVIENKERHDSWLKMAQMYQSLGQQEKMQMYLDKVDEDMLRIQEEKKRKETENNKPAATPTSGDTESPPIRSVNITNNQKNDECVLISNQRHRGSEDIPLCIFHLSLHRTQGMHPLPLSLTFENSL